MLKLVSFHIRAHFNAFLQILEYFSQIGLGPLATEAPCIIQRMRFACGINMARETHSGYVTLIAFPLQKWLRERASVIKKLPVLFHVQVCVTVGNSSGYFLNRSRVTCGQFF